jgi:hypothetical protein
VGVAFGADVTKNFLQRNGLQLVVRSHEVKEEGYEVEHDGCCITIFSAPNYCAWRTQHDVHALVRTTRATLLLAAASPAVAAPPARFAGDQMGNKGAFIRFDGSDMVPHFTSFDAVVRRCAAPMRAYCCSLTPSICFHGCRTHSRTRLCGRCALQIRCCNTCESHAATTHSLQLSSASRP